MGYWVKKYNLKLIKNGEIVDLIDISAKSKRDFFPLINSSIESAKHIHNYDEKVGKRLFKRFYLNLCKSNSN